jgi:2,3-dihydroxybenzoate decarboxylase
VETATHALRLMASGLFDRFPKFTVILGHLGEMLPSVMWRIDHRLIAEAKSPQLFGADILGMPAKKKLDHYLRNNFYVTTSGNFCTPTLMNAIEWLGTDRIMFAVDYPYESVNEAVLWFDNLRISDADLVKIGRTNAEKVLKLGREAKTAASV